MTTDKSVKTPEERGTNIISRCGWRSAVIEKAIAKEIAEAVIAEREASARFIEERGVGTPAADFHRRLAAAIRARTL